MQSVIYTRDVFMVRNATSYLGTTQQPSKVFAFTNPKHALDVCRLVHRSKIDVLPYCHNIYFIKHETLRIDKEKEEMYIEAFGMLNAQIQLVMNNVEMFICDSIIEDDDANIYLVNRASQPQPLYINEDIKKIHLNKLWQMN